MGIMARLKGKIILPPAFDFFKYTFILKPRLGGTISISDVSQNLFPLQRHLPEDLSVKVVLK
jgi:hypothetical protein